MVDLGGLFRRAKGKGADLAAKAPSVARQAATEARSTAGAVGEVLDDRTGGRLGEAVAKGGEVLGSVAATPGEVRDAFRAEAGRDTHRPDAYRPDPIEPPAPIDRPDPI